jgi:hypothetical protein
MYKSVVGISHWKGAAERSRYIWTNTVTELYNDQRNAQVFNKFIYLLLPYIFVWFQRPGADTIPGG